MFFFLIIVVQISLQFFAWTVSLVHISNSFQSRLGIFLLQFRPEFSVHFFKFISFHRRRRRRLVFDACECVVLCCCSTECFVYAGVKLLVSLFLTLDISFSLYLSLLDSRWAQIRNHFVHIAIIWGIFFPFNFCLLPSRTLSMYHWAGSTNFQSASIWCYCFFSLSFVISFPFCSHCRLQFDFYFVFSFFFQFFFVASKTKSWMEGADAVGEEKMMKNSYVQLKPVVVSRTRKWYSKKEEEEMLLKENQLQNWW